MKRIISRILRRTIYGLLPLAIMTPLVAGASSYKSIKVTRHDGSSVLIKGETGITMTMSQEEMNFFTDPSIPFSIPLQEVKSVTLSEKEGDITLAGVGEIKTDEITFFRAGDELVIGNLPAASRISIVSLGGMILHEAVAEGSYTVSLSSYPKGIYILSINNKTFKFSTSR